jgi:hypothetical protein
VVEHFGDASIDVPGVPCSLVAAQLDGLGPLDLAFAMSAPAGDRVEVAFGGDQGIGARFGCRVAANPELRCWAVERG